MEGCSTKKSESLETLVIQNIANVNELKAKLNDIIQAGRDYDYDVSSCLKTLLNSSDQEIVLLTLQAIAELSKCESKRQTYASNEVIRPTLNMLSKEVTNDVLKQFKHCCRVLGNLCCDNDQGRTIIMENNGIPTLISIIQKSIKDESLFEIKLLAAKTLLNFIIGGEDMVKEVMKHNLVDLIKNILFIEVSKKVMHDDMVSTSLLLLSVINDNNPEYKFNDEINCTVLNVMRETSNIEISELCLDHLHMQAESDSVKTLIAEQGGVQLLCTRLELLVARQTDGKLYEKDSEVESIMKQACDLIIIILTGDEAMHYLYDNATGEVYKTIVRWFDSSNYNLLATAVLAIGNFARQDDYCIQMLDDHIYDKLLDIFETYNGYYVILQNTPEQSLPVDASTAIKIVHAAASSLRNLSVSANNKATIAAEGRAAPLLLTALVNVIHHHIAYKILATLRLLVDGQESVANLVASNSPALISIGKWGRSPDHAGAAGEAPRLIAWTVKNTRSYELYGNIIQVEECISTLVSMLVASHSIMQNEAILALTLLAVNSLTNKTPETEKPNNNESIFIEHLLKSEIGKHVSVLIDTNCAKMPLEVAENLSTFLSITCKKNELASDYKENNVNDLLKKFVDSRKDLCDEFSTKLNEVIASLTSDDV